jgi:hypothetical protein
MSHLVSEPLDDLAWCLSAWDYAEAGGWPGYDESPYKHH